MEVIKIRYRENDNTHDNKNDNNNVNQNDNKNDNTNYENIIIQLILENRILSHREMHSLNV